MNEDKGIKGIMDKRSIPAQNVFGSELDRVELPENVRFYMQKAAFDPAKHKAVLNLYELRDIPGDTKMDKIHLEKINFVPDEEYIALNYGPSKDGYIFIGKIKAIDGSNVDMVSETIHISEKWRRRYEAHQKSLAPEDAKDARPASASQGALGPLDVLRLIQSGEDRAIAQMKAFAEIFNKRGDSPADVLAGAYKGASEMMERSLQTNLRMVQTISKAAETQVVEDEAPEEVVAPNPEESLPPVLRHFMPQIEAGITRLLGGGPVASATKTLILSSDDWKQVFRDKELFGQAVAAIEARFGSEKTERALDILLNRRKNKRK